MQMQTTAASQQQHFPIVVVVLGVRFEHKSGELLSFFPPPGARNTTTTTTTTAYDAIDGWVQVQLRVKYHTFRDQRLE
jgi:hypothetical protein